MRSTFLLASLLAVVPIISAIPARKPPCFVPNVQVSYGSNYILAGCHQVGGLVHEEPIDNITVEACIKKCSAKDYSQGGVAGDQCFCDTLTSGGKSLHDSQCEQTCAGDVREYCGTDATLILYEKNSN